MTTTSPPIGVIVGVDGSSSARNAVRWAARDAALREVPLTIVAVVPTVVGSRMMAPMPIAVLDWERESAHRVLDEATEMAKDCTDGSLDVSTVMPAGSAVPALTDLSQQAELLVVGRSGRSAISRTLLGSVSSGALHHAHCPVAVVHDDSTSAVIDDRAPVLVGVDGSQAGDHALEVACREASVRGVDLVAVHAWWTPGSLEIYGLTLDDYSRDLDTWLTEKLAPWQRRYPAITMRHSVVRDQPGGSLVDFPEPTQLIVVGSHGYGGFTGMLLGSVSHAVVQSARVPVIVARRH
jgi:nucleotide-binding universal stress UspA family protein